MKEIINISYESFQDKSQLSKEEEALIELAFEARAKAYAPYSQFLVGACLLLDNGEKIIGNNQENAAYPSGLCAERVAIYAAKSKFPDAKILKIAIVAGKDENNGIAIAPCGACRQSILEYENNQDNGIEIIFMGTKGEVLKFNSILELLPFAFKKEYL